MPSTNTITQTLGWAAAFLLQRPTTGVGGVALEPALTSANLIYQTIQSQPFRWNWNRAADDFNTTAGLAVYYRNLPNYGYLEYGSVCDTSAPTSTPSTFPLEVDLTIIQQGSPSNELGRPDRVSPLIDNGAGQITIMLQTIPDRVYNVSLIYQNAPALITNLGQTWAPIPDKYAFLYERGLLAQLHGMYDSALYQMEMGLFYKQLVGCSQGLDETEKAIFLEDSLRKVKTQAAAMNRG